MLEGLPIDFMLVRAKRNPDGTTTWIGRNALPGASFVAVASATRLDAIVALPSSSYEVHISDEAVFLLDKSSSVFACGNDGAGIRARERRILPTKLGGKTNLAFDLTSGTRGSNSSALSVAALSSSPVHSSAPTTYTSNVTFFYTQDAEIELTTKPTRDEQGYMTGPPLVTNLAGVPGYMTNTYRAMLEADNLVLAQSHIPNITWNFLGVFRVPDYTPSGGSMTADGTVQYDMLLDLQAMDYLLYPLAPLAQFVHSQDAVLDADQSILVTASNRNAAGISNGGDCCVVTQRADYLVLSHEMGHDFGLYHDRITNSYTGNADYNTDYRYNYGYQEAYGPPLSPTRTDILNYFYWGDIMSYAGRRQPYYSNPDIILARHAMVDVASTLPDGNYVLGVPAGQRDAANAARAMREMGYNLAGLRRSAGVGFPTVSTPIPVGGPSYSIGGRVELTATATGAASFLQWFRNGRALASTTSPSLTVANLGAADAGLYDLVVANRLGSVTSLPAILGATTNAKCAGAADVIRTDIRHPNGNVFDQVLLTGTTAVITADVGKITRISFVDDNDDIVQVEFSGAGALSVVLDPATASGPAPAVNYSQPGVSYVKGHASIVITDADETTNVSVFAVGKATAIDQTIFRSSAYYDGIADIGFVAITSTDGKFGGVRTANTRYSGSVGLTGIYAPGVQFTGPVYIGNIVAVADAAPVIILGNSFTAPRDSQVTGGDLWQPNSAPVRFNGFTAYYRSPTDKTILGFNSLRFTEGSDANGNTLSAKVNRGVLAHVSDSGLSDASDGIVINP